jgi:hypothetical protein
MPEPAANHEQNRPNRRNRLLRAKNGSLPSPTTNRRRVGDASVWGNTESSDWQPVQQLFWKQSLFYMGTLSPNPWDLSLWGNNGSLTHREVSAPSCLPLVGLELQQMTVRGGTGCTRPTIAAAEPALRSHPCGALFSAQLQSVSPNDMSPSRNIQ